MANPFEAEFTDAATEALDEYIQDIRAEILTRAAEIARAASSGAVEVTVRDVIAASDELQGRMRRVGIVDFRQRLLRAYSLIFTAAGVVGALLWVGPDLNSLDGQSRIGLLTALTGLLGLIASRAILDTRFLSSSVRRDDHRAMELVPLFMGEFAQLELALRDLNAFMLGESAASKNPTKVALESEILGEKNNVYLRSVSETRNRLAHGQDLTNEELRRSLHDLDRLLSYVYKQSAAQP